MTEFRSARRRQRIPEVLRNRSDRLELERQQAEAASVKNEAAKYESVGRLELAADTMRLVREGHAVPYVPIQLASPPSPSTARAFIFVDPENIPSGTPSATGVIISEFDKHVQAYQREHGCDVVTAIQAVQAARPDLARTHSAEIIKSVDRHIAARGTPADVQRFDQLVERRVEERGETYSVAIEKVAAQDPALAERRRLALSLPIGPGGVALADR